MSLDTETDPRLMCHCHSIVFNGDHKKSHLVFIFFHVMCVKLHGLPFLTEAACISRSLPYSPWLLLSIFLARNFPTSCSRLRTLTL